MSIDKFCSQDSLDDHSGGHAHFLKILSRVFPLAPFVPQFVQVADLLHERILDLLHPIAIDRAGDLGRVRVDPWRLGEERLEVDVLVDPLLQCLFLVAREQVDYGMNLNLRTTLPLCLGDAMRVHARERHPEFLSSFSRPAPSPGGEYLYFLAGFAATSSALCRVEVGRGAAILLTGSVIRYGVLQGDRIEASSLRRYGQRQHDPKVSMFPLATYSIPPARPLACLRKSRWISSLSCAN
jgi:hypothetical protein